MSENGILEALIDTERGGGTNKFIVYKLPDVPVAVSVTSADSGNTSTGTFSYPPDGYLTMPYAVGEIWFPNEGCWNVTATDGLSTVSMDYLVTFVAEW